MQYEKGMMWDFGGDYILMMLLMLFMRLIPDNDSSLSYYNGLINYVY